MKPFVDPAFTAAYPEFFLAFMIMMLLLLGVARKEENYKAIANLAIMSLVAVGVVIFKCSTDTVTAFKGMYIVDDFASYMKILVITGSAFSIFMSTRYIERERIKRYEYPVLILFSTLGMLLMISAHSLMTLYVSLELQSLPLYVLAAFQRDSVRSTEAGLKYFVLGALSSGMLLYGASLIYGYTGTTGFDHIAAMLPGDQPATLGLIVGMVMLLSGLAFKIGAVPFHMWTPDVYEGSPTSVTAFFAIVPKVAAIALLVRLFMGPFGHMIPEWRQVIGALSIASMALGSIAAVGQTNIKRLMAYSAIGNMGYALVGLAAANEEGVKAILIYMTIYVATTIGVFAVILMMKQKDKMVENMSSLAGLASRQPLLALAMTLLMFSMAGIPPMAGFFGKLFIFQAAIDAKLYALAVIGVLTSVIAAYYYLRIIKIMYFDMPADEPIDAATDRSLNFALLASSFAIMIFITVPGPLLAYAENAAQVLLK